MDFDVISKGILINFILIISVSSFLIFQEFSLSINVFTFILLSTSFFSGLLVGYITKTRRDHAWINGLFSGTGSAALLLAFISMYSSMDWQLNAFLLSSWSLVSSVGAWLGSFLRN